MALVLVDTSAVFALIDRKDANHAAAKSRLRSLKKTRSEPILTNFLVSECHALLLARIGHEVARQWLLTNVWRVEPVLPSDEQHARDIIRRCTDKGYSYTDATSFAVMERLGLVRVFSFDRHFKQYGFELI